MMGPRLNDRLSPRWVAVVLAVLALGGMSATVLLGAYLWAAVLVGFLLLCPLLAMGREGAPERANAVRPPDARTHTGGSDASSPPHARRPSRWWVGAFLSLAVGVLLVVSAVGWGASGCESCSAS